MIHADAMATVWVLHGGQRGQLVRRFLDDGQIGIAVPEFPDGRTLDRPAALRILGVGMDDEPTKQQEAHVAMFLSFVRRIAVADVAVLIDPVAGGLVCGVVTGDYEYRTDVDDAQARHRRPVDWRRRLPEADLPERLAHVPRQRALLEDVPDGRLRDLALQACRGERGEDPHDRPAVPVRRPRAPRSSSTRRAPVRPKAATRPERRCTFCLITKPADLFEDGADICADCN